MWHTPDGQRILLGAEAELVQRSIESIVSQLYESNSDDDACTFESGISVFDQLQLNQKIVVLRQVACYLLTDTDAPLPLTAVNEAAVGAVFENIRQHVETEIEHCSVLGQMFPIHNSSALSCDEEPWTIWRSKILAAEFATLSRGEWELLVAEGFHWPSEDCLEIERWDEIIESLADRILWDRDYEMSDSFLDDDPLSATARKEMLGIEHDYFIDTPPDPNDDELEGVISEIHSIVRRKPR